MMQNLVMGEALQVFEQKARERVLETNANYELVMKDLISHFSPALALQRQKRYLRGGGGVQTLRHQDPIFHGTTPTINKVFNLVEVSLPKEWQK